MQIEFSEHACRTIEHIQRDGESVEETVNRILATLLPTAPDFDHFYGEPRDGRGPSGGEMLSDEELKAAQQADDGRAMDEGSIIVKGMHQ